MKRAVPVIVCVVGMLIFGWCPVVFGEIVFSTSFRYDTASDNADPENIGSEFTLPFGLAYRGERLSLSVESAYSDALVDFGDEPDGELAGLTDMLAALNYTYTLPQRPMAVTAGLGVNLPTGQERLDEQEAGAEWGESNDLFEVDNFGEGLNISAGLGLLRQFRQLTVALQGTYIFHGEFDPTTETSDDDLDPGDQWLAMSVLDWTARSWLRVNVYASYAYFLADKTEGEQTFRQAQQVVIGSNISLTRQSMTLALGFQGMLPGKNSVLVDGVFEKEAERSNGTDVFGLAALTYQVSSRFNVRLQGDIRYYGESPLSDDQTGRPFSGKRVRYAAGPGFSYAMNSHLSWNGLLKLFIMQQQQDMFLDDAVEYRGLNLDIGMRYTL